MVIYGAKNVITILGVDKAFDKETHCNLSIKILKFCSVNADSVGKPSQQFTITNYKPFSQLFIF